MIKPPFDGGNGSYPYSGPIVTATGTAGYGEATGIVLFTGGAGKGIGVELGRWRWGILVLGALGWVI